MALDACAVLTGIDLAELERHVAEPGCVERHELELRLADVDEAPLLLELEAIVERLEPSDTAPRVEEVWGPREEPQEPGEVLGGVDDLPEAVERLASGVLPRAEDGLELVDDDDEALVVGRLHNLEDAAQVRERVLALDVALDLGLLLRARADVAAPREPGHERARVREVSALLQIEDGADDAHHVLGRATAGHRREALLELGLHLGVEVGGVRIRAEVDEVVLDGADPAVHHVAERAARTRAGAELTHDLLVDLVEVVEAEIVVGDDDEAGREPARLRVEDRQARGERLAAAVAAAEALEDALLVAGHVEQTPDLRALSLHADGERVEPSLGHAPRPKLLEHMLRITTRKGHLSLLRPSGRPSARRRTRCGRGRGACRSSRPTRG